MKNIFNPFFWKDCKTKVSCFFFPRQRWLTKKIPNEWCEKDELIRILLFECLVEYVDGEKCFEVLCWDADEYKEHFVDAEPIIKKKENLKKTIQDAYNYIKVERPQLIKDHEASYPTPIGPAFTSTNGKTVWTSCESQYGMSFAEAYGENMRLEELIDSLDQKYLHDIIEIRQTLWT